MNAGARSPCRFSTIIAQSHNSRPDQDRSHIEAAALDLSGKFILLSATARVGAILIVPALQQIFVGYPHGDSLVSSGVRGAT